MRIRKIQSDIASWGQEKYLFNHQFRVLSSEVYNSVDGPRLPMLTANSMLRVGDFYLFETLG